MKKTLLALAAVASAAFAANAQTELSLSYGAYTQMDCMDMTDGAKANTAWGAVNAGVNFRVGNNFWLGPSYTFSSASFKHADGNAYYHVIMLNGRYNYYRRGDLTMYAKAGIGVDITHRSFNDGDYTDNKAYCAFQLTPIGAAYSLSRQVDMFAELGFGAQGLLQVGFKFKL